MDLQREHTHIHKHRNTMLQGQGERAVYAQNAQSTCVIIFLLKQLAMLNIARQAFNFRIRASAQITPEGNSPKNSANIVLFPACSGK